jgi:hypothetical protein
MLKHQLAAPDAERATFDGAVQQATPDAAPDPAARALDDLIAAIGTTQRLLDQALARAHALRDSRRSGAGFREIVPEEPRPLLVEIVSDSVLALVEAGSRFRRAEARALHDEGMTMEAIAGLFGVTRQRISHLLRSARTAVTEREPLVAE